MSVLGVIVFLAVGSILISLLITLIAYIGKVYMKKYNKMVDGDNDIPNQES